MKIFLIFPLAILAACQPAGPVEMSAAEQGDLAEALRGRTAEATVSCIDQRNAGGNRSIGEGIVLFGDRGDKIIYVNRPAAGCPIIDSSRALVIRTTSNRLCRGDIASVVDPGNGFGYGGCTLGEFTPYRRVN
ncbi:MAG: hypothetical protein H0W74_01155 [Sphingosinicella sp.]|nr:hypothetical protein [Sphingosinicella sp.]